MQLRRANMEWLLCTVLDNIHFPSPVTLGALRGELCRVTHQLVPSLGGRALVSDQSFTLPDGGAITLFAGNT